METDYKLILRVLHDMDHARVLLEAEKKEWTKDASIIFFPQRRSNPACGINELDAIQYLQRIRLLYTTLMRHN